MSQHQVISRVLFDHIMYLVSSAATLEVSKAFYDVQKRHEGKAGPIAMSDTELLDMQALLQPLSKAPAIQAREILGLISSQTPPVPDIEQPMPWPKTLAGACYRCPDCATTWISHSEYDGPDACPSSTCSAVDVAPYFVDAGPSDDPFTEPSVDEVQRLKLAALAKHEREHPVAASYGDYGVQVARSATRYAELSVLAYGPADAELRAEDAAANVEFTSGESDAEYTTENVVSFAMRPCVGCSYNWNDPDEDVCSQPVVVTGIHGDVVHVQSQSGDAFEVMSSELSPIV